MIPIPKYSNIFLILQNSNTKMYQSFSSKDEAHCSLADKNFFLAHLTIRIPVFHLLNFRGIRHVDSTRDPKGRNVKPKGQFPSI